MKVDKSKQYKTRDGHDVRVYTTDGGGDYPVHGAILNGELWEVKSWTLKGKYCIPNPGSRSDLIEVKPRVQRTGWVNVYPEGLGSYYETKVWADEERMDNCIACVKIEIDCEEGEGLEE